MKKKAVKSSGHFERVDSVSTTYLYVNNLKPSGIPGALVVPKEEVNNGDDIF